MARTTGSKNRVVKDPSPESRKGLMLALQPGESVIFCGDPGSDAAALQRSVSSSFRGGARMSDHGLAQTTGWLSFEGELPTPVSRVTREK